MRLTAARQIPSSLRNSGFNPILSNILPTTSALWSPDVIHPPNLLTPISTTSASTSPSSSSSASASAPASRSV